jgi:hypothetical protein
METAHAMLPRKHLRDQQMPVPNLENSGRPIQRLQDVQVHDLAMLLQATECLQRVEIGR